MSPDPSMLPSQLLFLICILLVYAFFAASEMAIVSVNKTKLKLLAEMGNKKADNLLKELENPESLLFSAKILIRLLSFFGIACSTFIFYSRFCSIMVERGITGGDSILLLPLLVFLIAFIFISIGELYPGKLALQHTEVIALFSFKFVKFFAHLIKPLVFLLSGFVVMLLRITGQKTDVSDEEFSEDDIKSMLEVGQETGVLKEEGKKMINSIFAFDDKLAYEIMTPRTDVFYIDIDDPAEEYMDELMELRYSRIPVYEDDSDNIIGILNIKDYLIKAKDQGFENVDLRSILRKPYLVPETKNIDSLFFELQNSKQHIAILIDEYGGFSGIVTMEDIIEQVMGNIDDEYDEEELSLEKIDDNTYIVDGFINLHDLNEELDIQLESENSETLGGLIIDLLGEIPEEDEKEARVITHEGLKFTVKAVKDRRIEKIKLEILPDIVSDDNHCCEDNSIDESI